MGLGITGWDWAIFVTAVVIFLLLDLGVFHRKAHEVKFKEALAWSTLWFILAFVFAFLIAPRMAENWTSVERNEFITGYIIELSLSMDNVFVIALIFQYFRVPLKYQHRVLFWGILGALVMRGVMIWLGTGLINRFQFFLYLIDYIANLIDAIVHIHTKLLEVRDCVDQVLIISLAICKEIPDMKFIDNHIFFIRCCKVVYLP